jgi:hypothetical protein
MSKIIGDEGEQVVAKLLQDRGYSVRLIGGNYPVIDLEVDAERPFRVSVKTSASKRHVRMGSPNSLAQLRDDDFLIAILPKIGSGFIDLADNEFEVLIIPGDVARDGGLHVHETYLEEQKAKGKVASGSAGVLVKSYSRRLPQLETWAKFELCANRWDLLPSAIEVLG